MPHSFPFDHKTKLLQRLQKTPLLKKKALDDFHTTSDASHCSDDYSEKSVVSIALKKANKIINDLSKRNQHEPRKFSKMLF